MKKYFYYAMVAMMMNIPFTGCSSEDSNVNEPLEEYGNFIESVEEQSGTIYYDEQLHMWYIYQVGGNTGIIDSVIKYFPINLSKDFQEEGLTVSFSGKLYTPEFTIPQIGGVSYYVIELSLMSRQGQDIL